MVYCSEEVPVGLPSITNPNFNPDHPSRVHQANDRDTTNTKNNVSWVWRPKQFGPKEVTMLDVQPPTIPVQEEAGSSNNGQTNCFKFIKD